MFIQVGWGEPNPGREEDAFEGQMEFARSLVGKPGLLHIYSVLDKGTGKRTGVSVWADEASWRNAMATAVRTRKGDPTVYAVAPTSRIGEVVWSWAPGQP
jgi:hypothetical protein